MAAERSGRWQKHEHDSITIDASLQSFLFMIVYINHYKGDLKMVIHLVDILSIESLFSSLVFFLEGFETWSG